MYKKNMIGIIAWSFANNTAAELLVLCMTIRPQRAWETRFVHVKLQWMKEAMHVKRRLLGRREAFETNMSSEIAFYNEHNTLGWDGSGGMGWRYDHVTGTVCLSYTYVVAADSHETLSYLSRPLADAYAPLDGHYDNSQLETSLHWN